MAPYLILVGAIALYALAASRLQYFYITGPIIFVAIGFFLGSGGVSLIDLGPGTTLVRTVTSVTLALLLFSDASKIRLGALGRDAGLIGRLLLVALPLAIVLGTGVGWLLLPALGVGMWVLLATILAPTDLSLGLAMFGNPRVPGRVSRMINVESGLNDGIAAPLVTLFIGWAVTEAEHGSGPLREAVAEIAIGVGIGLAVGLLGGLLLRVSRKSGWSSAASRQYSTLALTLVAYGGAVALHGNGFIAAFVGGIAFGIMAREDAHETVEYAEKTGTLLTFGVWFVFGTAVAPVIISDGLSWRPVFYALLSLTFVRMAPVALSLLGKKLQGSTLLFVGWFGPRGLASVVFLILALEQLAKDGIETSLLTATVGWTVLLSVVLHGISAGPVAGWYGSRAEKFPPGSPELEPAGEAHSGRSLARPASVHGSQE